MDLKRRDEQDRLVQERYARWLDAGTKIALVLLAASFLAYVTGLLPPQLPPEELAKLWGLPLKEYLAAAGAPTGWGWLELRASGDYINYFGMVLLASIVMVAYLGVLPRLLRHDRGFAAIAALEIVVLLVAASGLLAGAR